MSNKAGSEQVEELYLLQRVAQKINSILDPDILLEEIVGDVAQTFGYTRACILLKDFEKNELVIAAVKGWTVNFHTKGDRFKIGDYGIIGHTAESGETYYSPDVRVDPYYRVSEESTLSEVAIPLKKNNELTGIFDLQHQDVNAFSPERIALLESLANHIEIAIENARLFQRERLEKERMLNELREANNIQINLFPSELPDISGFKVAGTCLPCLEVGGDWYDFIPFPNGKVGIVLADVSGKGMGAALLMSSTRSLLRLIADSETPPKEVLKKLNSILLNDFPNNKYVTMIYAVLNPENQQLVFSNAGHLYPLYISPTERNFIRVPEGLPLGITECDFSDQTVDFSTGGKLIFYSDGVTEAMNSVSEEFGAERLMQHFEDKNSSVKSLISEIKKFTTGQQQFDDITVVSINHIQ